MLTAISTSTGDYRHIVFADELRGPGRALNMAPGSAAALLAERERAHVWPLTPEQARFLRWLFNRAGLDAACYREETLSRRLPACLRALRCGSLEEARWRIEALPRLLLTAIDAMLIGVTSFFRDRAVFAALAHQILPAVLSQRQGTVRIWSAGCSDGSEAWSLAMLLDSIDPDRRAHLLATDCRPTAVRTAAAGVYSDSDVRTIPRELLHRCFIRELDRWRANPRLRERITFRTADVLRFDEAGSFDLILCRNLAMYLRPEALARLWQHVYDALSPGGILVVGKAERPVGLPLRPVLPCILRRE